MEKNLKNKQEIISLNESSDENFLIQELDKRLETDPLFTNGLFDFMKSQYDSSSTSWCITCHYCNGSNECHQN